MADRESSDERLGGGHLMHDFVPWWCWYASSGDDVVLHLSEDGPVDLCRSDLSPAHVADVCIPVPLEQLCLIRWLMVMLMLEV